MLESQAHSVNHKVLGSNLNLSDERSNRATSRRIGFYSVDSISMSFNAGDRNVSLLHSYISSTYFITITAMSTKQRQIFACIVTI